MYGLLLRLFCPQSFRNEYGGEMEALFARQVRQAGAFGAVWLWLKAIPDVAFAGLAAHTEILMHDLRYTIRSMAKAPQFALAVIGITALGISAATAVFSVANHVFLRPLPFPEPDRLVRLWRDYRPIGYWKLETSPAEFGDWARRTTSMEGVAAFHYGTANLFAGGYAKRLDSAVVTGRFFSVLGVNALIGRTLAADDDSANAPAQAVLSYASWQGDFGGNPAIIGRTIHLDGQPHTVVGVMPATFLFPNRNVRLWTSIRLEPGDYSQRNNYYLYVLGRLRHGVNFDHAAVELRSIGAALRQENPEANKNCDIFLSRMADEMPERSRMMLSILAAAAALLLLIACSNLASLLLARSATRGRELAVRAALGAGHDRLLRQLMTENLTLALLGGTAGVALSWAAVPFLAWLVPLGMPIAESPSVDWRVVIFAVMATMLTGLLFGAVPASRTARGALGLRSAIGSRRERARQILVALQVAASLTLAISTGMMGRAMLRLGSASPGFQTEGRLFFKTQLPFPRYWDLSQRERYYSRMLAALRALPGVKDAGITSFRPLGPFQGGIWPVQSAGSPGAGQFACVRFVTPGYFAAMGIPLIRGRDIAASDVEGSLPVAVVSESFAKAHWPGESGLGRTFETFGDLAFTVVGVAGNVHFRGPERVAEPQFYPASGQTRIAAIHFHPKDFVLSTSLQNPESLMPSIRRIVADIDPMQPVSDAQTGAELASGETASRRTQLWVVALFASAALLLAAAGIHGMLSLSIGQRTQEIGLRRALGADHAQVARVVLGEAAGSAALGVAFGFVGAYAANRAMQSFLAGVPLADAPLFLFGTGVVAATVAIGSASALLRALRVDPAIALRAE